MEIHDRLFLPLFQPEIPGNPTVVLVHFAISFAPVVELAGGDLDPFHQLPGADLGLLRPAPDKIHDLVPRIMRYPGPGQSSPRLFFKAICSAISSARTSSLVWIFFPGTGCGSVGVDGGRAPWPGRRRLHFRRTPSASGRRPSAGAPIHHTTMRSAPCPTGAASGWRPSLRPCSAFVSFSRVLSVILTAERPLHFQLRRNKRFAAYIEGLATAAGHEDRQAPLKNYCKGLLLPGERKSIEPMAARLDAEHVQAMRQSLHHLVAKAPWSDDVLLEQVRNYVLPTMRKQGPVVAWIVDDTGFPKKGKHSVGVTRQYCGQVGKQENCRVAVSLSLSTWSSSLPIAYRLYLPKEWAEDGERRDKTEVPEEVAFQTKPAIA